MPASSLALYCALLLSTANPRPHDPALRVWKEAGAEVGSIHVNYGFRHFKPGRGDGGMLGLRLAVHKYPGLLQRLPAPVTPFGLELSGARTRTCGGSRGSSNCGCCACSSSRYPRRRCRPR